MVRRAAIKMESISNLNTPKKIVVINTSWSNAAIPDIA